ncbi:MAG: cell division protein FtsB [Burkholderiaceae bacterium]|nr:MAG: cell division protein FtsB [Burkholderiaceae bacterium]|tara:strand:- start:538 stop:825 length:288 start_codon:yes stop_codon:yes gene_type:complete
MKFIKSFTFGTTILVFFLITVQLVLWFGEGGWLATIAKQNNFLELEKEVREDEEILLKLRAEARDLQEGHSSIEERARFQHGMLKKGEVFIQLHP